eukprot:CAMPEP_0198222950 /NCGR_PEP_ID=MMETSP1445-20131203/90359_1 /TAXON_ID=36898 /ORGANISM="Pyramimonas sp., Strain CCMP2087" /LENGTH=429 /DNA_ID=CAMNT_0043901635 /DNA_START=229 /DNA_END=1518 /DNA_ORIENTATION=+
MLPENEKANRDAVKEVADVGVGLVTDTIMSVAKAIPVYGVVVQVLEEIVKAARNAKQNKKACAHVAIWATSVRDALTNAVPVLTEFEGIENSIGDLLTLLSGVINDLLEMTISYTNRHYIMKLITSTVFKTKFGESQAAAQNLLGAMQLSMMSVQLRLTARKASADSKMEQDVVVQALSENMNLMVTSKIVVVDADEKLDLLIEEQHKELVLLEKSLDQQGKTNVKLDDLLDMITRIDPNVAPKSYTFSVSGALTQTNTGGFSNVFLQRFTSRISSLPSWSVARTFVGQDDVLDEKEWDWLEKYLGGAFIHDFGEIRIDQRNMFGDPEVPKVFSTNLLTATGDVSSTLRLDDRGVKLSFDGLTASLAMFEGKFTLKWRVGGPDIKSSNVSPACTLLPLKEDIKPPENKALKEFDAIRKAGAQPQCCQIQ